MSSSPALNFAGSYVCPSEPMNAASGSALMFVQLSFPSEKNSRMISSAAPQTSATFAPSLTFRGRLLTAAEPSRENGTRYDGGLSICDSRRSSASAAAHDRAGGELAAITQDSSFGRTADRSGRRRTRETPHRGLDDLTSVPRSRALHREARPAA